MRYIFLDVESYYSADYTLSGMTPPEYILDPRFELICAAAQEGDGEVFFIDGPDFERWLKTVDPASACFVTHNALFDMAVLAWRYQYVPARMVCTSLLAKATIGAFLKNTRLKTVATALGLGAKDEQALVNAKGLRRADILASGYWDRYCRYNLDDTRMCAGIFNRIGGALSLHELDIMDMVIRCTIEPQLVLDVPRLEANLARIVAEKLSLLEQAGTTVTDLMSAPKFKRALEAMGVEVEHKTSPTGRTIPAFARTDSFMVELSEHEDPRVQAMAAARLGHKSTIEETRCKRLIAIGRLPWPTQQPLIPAPLIYGGTHTHRLSGTWKLNLQNLPKKKTDGTGGELRDCLLAPPGHKLLVADLSQIEARILATLAGEDALRDAFARGEDVYASFASLVFGYPVTKKTHPDERFIGKTGVLGLGYMCGVKKFYNMVLRDARKYGINLNFCFDLAFAQRVVDTYRRGHPAVTALWRQLDRLIKDVLGGSGEAQLGPLQFVPGKIVLPGDLCLHYPKLHNNGYGDYEYTWGRETSKIYGGALCENIIQALARNVAMEATSRLSARGLRFVLQVHDELVFVVPEETCRSGAANIIREEMTRPVPWMPTIPLEVEISKPADRYGEAK